MKDVNECAGRFQDLIYCLMELATLQSDLDATMMQEVKKLPAPCVPEIYQDEGVPAAGSCDIDGERKYQEVLSQQRQTAARSLRDYADYVNETYEQPKLAAEVEALADELLQDQGNIVALTGISRVFTKNVNEMFHLFAMCLNEGG